MNVIKTKNEYERVVGNICVLKYFFDAEKIFQSPE